MLLGEGVRIKDLYAGTVCPAMIHLILTRVCVSGKYCYEGAYAKIFPCTREDDGGACFFGRGPMQLSWNSNYGNFMLWLRSRGIDVDLVKHPDLLISHLNPPLLFLGSIW